MPSLCVAARASRIADIVASVPELTSRTSSTEGTKAQIFFASSSSRAVGAPKLVPRAIARPERLDDRGMAVPENERPVGADVVDVLAAVLVPYPRALPGDDESRSEVETPEGPHRRVDASGHVLERLAVQLFASAVGTHGVGGYQFPR